MLTVIICDDDPEHLRQIHAGAEAYFAAHSNFPATVQDFATGEAVLEWRAGGGSCDIALLDICMPGMSGMQLARELRSGTQKPLVIFLTTSTDFAVDAFALNATHYLVKPFTGEQLSEALDRALSALAPMEPKRLALNVANGAVRLIHAEDILYIESIGYKRYVHTATEEIAELRKPLSVLLDELEALKPGQFIAPYRGYIVNLDAVRTVTSKNIVLQNGTTILIKSGDFRKLRDIFFAYSFSTPLSKGGGYANQESAAL